MLQLMGEQDLYDYWVDTMKTSATNWNLEAARSVLETWQRKFVAVSIGCCFLMLVSLGKRTIDDQSVCGWVGGWVSECGACARENQGLVGGWMGDGEDDGK